MLSHPAFIHPIMHLLAMCALYIFCYYHYVTMTGDVTISGNALYNPHHQILTCISTGGPATTVTWNRYSTTITKGTGTVLDDQLTAQYTHTLTLTTGGEYTCTVKNNKPSSDSATITVPGIL